MELLMKIIMDQIKDRTIDINRKLYIPKIDFKLSPVSRPNTIAPLNAIAAIPILNPLAKR